ncbi:MAG: cytochrome b N-terminal domain-containing protein [Deltaproteobacteria bacterium]|nr:cytochrome b N-terminal domain-containing protein [Deltaproteobacteria bacterium]
MDAVTSTPTPKPSRLLAKLINPIYRFFDWLYGSGYNPLYRSGTLAVGLLFVLLVTGLYLSFFYSVSQPYESIVGIQAQAWLGRWIRALHRYATVAAVIAIAFHVIQLLVQGKNWGPRTLAWLSGIILTAMFFVSAWSGYVMVWDTHGQKVAQAGAQLLSLIPMLHDVVIAAFDGSSEVPAGFFFMNLFLHLAIPVVMIMFLWVHTARLARAVWFPIRSIFIWSSAGLVVLALLWPAPLLEKADLLQVVGRIPLDLSTGFWIPWLDSFGAGVVWIALSLTVALFILIPWIWRPSRSNKRPISVVDEDACTGCTQCARDCPYEAISMVPRKDGRRLIAEVSASYCVSCGICAASCADFAIGPPDRTAVDQRRRVKEFCAQISEADGAKDVVLVACTNNARFLEVLSGQVRQESKMALYPVECCGCLHTEVIEQLLNVTKGVALVGCPARNCFNRDGGELLTQRIYEKRVPFLDRNVDRSRLLLTTYSEAESAALSSDLRQFTARLSQRPQSAAGYPWQQWIRAAAASVIFLILCGFLAQAPSGTNPSHGFIRAVGLLPSSLEESCRQPEEGELQGMPAHMRPKMICSKIPLEYELSIIVNGAQVARHSISDPLRRTDRPIFLNHQEQLLPGHRHDISIRLKSNGSAPLECRFIADLDAGQIHLIKYDREKGVLNCPDQSLT